MNMANVIDFYDVDSVADVKNLISVDPSIADKSVIDKLASLNLASTDLVLVKKTMDGRLKITDINRVDVALISSYLK